MINKVITNIMTGKSHQKGMVMAAMVMTAMVTEVMVTAATDRTTIMP